MKMESYFLDFCGCPPCRPLTRIPTFLCVVLVCTVWPNYTLLYKCEWVLTSDVHG